MQMRDVYLKIESIPGYCPVEPDDHVAPPISYRRDCMRNMGHEDGMIAANEVASRRLTAQRRPRRRCPSDTALSAIRYSRVQTSGHLVFNRWRLRAQLLV
jgi:hypothetical protein